MSKSLTVTLSLILLATPAFAKPHSDVYPVACNDLWDAVKDTLANPGNYSYVSAEDSELKATFVIVGSQHQAVNSVQLNAPDAGTCTLQIQLGYAAYGIDDEGLLRKRVAHTLDKLKATKPAAPQK